ncbi:MAG: 50S ribosomal protein L9 [Planctomycetaceae bacterium]
MVQQTANNQLGVSRKTIEVLLAENVDQLGEQGEIVRVRKGYARNFLLPQGLATVATENNKRMVERHRQKLVEIQAERLKALRDQAVAISKYSVTIEANANAEGHLYGSILAHDISKSLVAAGYAIDADHIRLEGPLKELGMYTVKLELHPEVKTEVKVWVVPAAAK